MGAKLLTPTSEDAEPEVQERKRTKVPFRLVLLVEFRLARLCQ